MVIACFVEGLLSFGRKKLRLSRTDSECFPTSIWTTCLQPLSTTHRRAWNLHIPHIGPNPVRCSSDHLSNGGFAANPLASTGEDGSDPVYRLLIFASSFRDLSNLDTPNLWFHFNNYLMSGYGAIAHRSSIIPELSRSAA